MKVHYLGGPIEFRGEIKRQGYRLSRKLERSDMVPRTWGRGNRKFQIGQLQQIDAWLREERYSIDQIIRLVRFHMGYNIHTETQFSQALLRSGYTWVYCVERFEHEGDSLRRSDRGENEKGE